MMFTATMKYLVAVVLDKYMDTVTKELLKLGLMHFVKITEFDSGLEAKLSSVPLSVSITKLAEIRKRIESFLSIIKVFPDFPREKDIEGLRAVDIRETEKNLDEISGTIQAMRERQKAIQSEILRLEDIKRQVGLFGDISQGLKMKSQYSFLLMHAGVVPTSNLGDFQTEMQKFPSVVLTFQEADSKTYVLVIAMKRDESQVGTILDRFGFLEIEITQEMLGVKDEVGHTIDAKITVLASEQEALAADANDIIEKNREKLLTIWENLKLNELYYRIQSNFSRTARTVVFSGWIPAAKQQQVQATLSKATSNRFYSEWRSVENVTKEMRGDVKVPVKLSNAKAFSPFQMLVTNFSTPAYGTIDPTPIVAVLYLIMFGLMFADAGQGVVLMIVGTLGVLWRRNKKDGLYEILKLIIYGGIISIIAGVVFGSYFGMPWFPAIWYNLESLLKPESAHAAAGGVRSIIDVLVITLYFGIMTIGLGLLLNWINCIRTRKWFLLLFDKGGILGSWIYAGGVYVVYSFAQTGFKSVPDNKALLLSVGIPVCLIALKPVFEFILHKKHDPSLKFGPATPFKFFGEWLMEIFEIFSGYLSNTLSFMRVAGLGIAHVALMSAFFTIAAKLGSNGEFSIISWLVLVLGNVIVIAFEGLSAGIQSLRLNYYEFFSKYFKGSGEVYTPVSLEDGKQ